MSQTFYQMMQQLEQRVKMLEKENLQLKEKLDNIKPVVINYKIQEINVEELKGTLNIGVTGEATIGEIDEVVTEAIKSNNNED